jgi:hypothetical protein
MSHFNDQDFSFLHKHANPRAQSFPGPEGDAVANPEPEAKS